MRPAIAGTLLLICSIACTGSHPSDAPSGRIDSVDAWARALVASGCKSLFRCPLPIEEDLQRAITLGSEAHCIEAFERTWDTGMVFIDPGGPVSELRRLESEGHIHVDPKRAQQCLDGWVGCWSISPGVSACREVIEGDVELGEPCLLTVECAGEAYCDFGAGSCPGTCSARKAPGEPCGFAGQCRGDGLPECWEERGSGGAHCALTEISVAAGEGAACDLGRKARVMCPDGLWCRLAQPETDATGTCQRPIALGETCRLRIDVCEAGALCHGTGFSSRCQEVKLIAAPETIDAAGRTMSCELSETGPPRQCDAFEGWFCGRGGVCELAGDGSDGARCDASGSDASIPCGLGLYCDPSTGTCTPLLPSGARCDMDSACESRACDDVAGTCRDRYCEAS